MFISEITARFRQLTKNKASSRLEHHLTTARPESHQLVHPLENLEDRMCEKHNKPLELFCKTDQTYVCSLCPVLSHKDHDFVPLKEEYEAKKLKLEKTEAEIQQMIQQRQLKIQEINQSAKLSREAADKKKAEGFQVFTALKQLVEKSRADFKDIVDEKQKSTEKQAGGIIKELQQELFEQRERAAEMEKLSRSKDHLHLLQSLLSISTAPPNKEWTQVRVHQRSHEGNLEKGLAQLEETISKKLNNILALWRVQQFAVDVTLDPDTAHPDLTLSDDGKQVHCGDLKKGFGECFVLGKQKFSSGRFYYEVQVKGQSGWIVGVTRESLKWRCVSTLCPQNGYWAAKLGNTNQLQSLKSKPEKVGVFVDYAEGLVSFYNVDAEALMFSYTGCSFNDKLLPFFSPFPGHFGKNSNPLIISAVSHTE